MNTYDGNSNQTDDTDLHEIKTHDVIRLNILCNLRKSDLFVLQYWEERFNLIIDFDWDDALDFKFQKLKNTKVKQCNFKTIVFYLIGITYSIKWKIVNENLCVFCMKAESYFHVLLIDCPRISLFWKRVIDYTHSNFNETLLLNERLLIVGIEFNHPNATDINIYDINIFAQYMPFIKCIWVRILNDVQLGPDMG